MRNQAYFLAACAAAVIGCGGSGGNKRGTSGTTSTTSTTSTTGTTGGGSGMSVVLPGARYGRVEVSYLTGEGRADGDVYLEITRQRLQNGDGVDAFERTDGLGPINLRLSGFQTLSTGIDVDFQTVGLNPNSAALSQLVFDPNRVLVEQTVTDPFSGATSTALVPGVLPTAGAVGSSLSVPANIDARIRAFPGRIAGVQLRVSGAVFYYDDSLGSYVFDQARFRQLNALNTGTDPTGNGLLASRLSDFVRFGLGNAAGTTGLPLTERPFVRTSYDDVADPTSAADAAARTRAGYVYASGDNFALSTVNPGVGSSFEEIAPSSDDAVIGSWAAKASTTVGDFVGTYNLTDANPVEVAGVPTRLVSLFGSFRDYTEVLTGGGTFEMVMFPNSGEQYDGLRQGDVVAFVRNSSGQITQMYTGGVNLSGTGNTSGTFELLPVFYLGVSASYGEGTPAGTRPDGLHPKVSEAIITGTVSGYRTATGASATASNPATIRRMSFTLTGNAPSGVSSTGTVTVFRS